MIFAVCPGGRQNDREHFALPRKLFPPARVKLSLVRIAGLVTSPGTSRSSDDWLDGVDDVVQQPLARVQQRGYHRLKLSDANASRPTDVTSPGMGD